ncbi:MAG: hypothetical protein ABFR89_09780 [Actinomycetota bacterium]
MNKLIAGLVIAAALTVGACNSPSDAPPITPEIEGDLSARAIEIVYPELRHLDMYVRDHLLTVDTLIGDEQLMPPETRSAIAERFPRAFFVGADEVDLLFTDDVVTGDGVIISVGPLEELATKVVGIPIGVTHARYDYFGAIVQFSRSDDEWRPASSEETGVTVTTAVS